MKIPRLPLSPSALISLFPVLLAVVCLQARAALNIQSWMLPDGAKVLFVESHVVPILDLNVDFDAGDRRDPDGKAGLASLTNAMLARGVLEDRVAANGQGAADAVATGAPALTEAQLSDAFADTGAQRSGGTGNDRASVGLRTLSSAHERDAAVLLLARLIAAPAFPAELLARDKGRITAALREELTRPEALAERAFWRLTYGTHPYGQEPTVASIDAIGRDDIVLFHRTHYVANRAVVSIVGDVSRAQADAIAKQLTARLPQGAPLPALPAVPPVKPTVDRIAHPASQAHILLGEPALERGDPDFFPLAVGNYVLGGGGFVSRLTQQVREKRGLSYSVYSYFSPLAQKGPFQIGLQTRREQTDAALKVVRDTLDDFLRNGPTAAEIQAAKDNLIGGFALRLDNNRKILDNVAMIGYYDMPLDYLDTWTDHVAAVTLPQIRDAFARRVSEKDLVTVIVGGGDRATP